MTVRVELSQSQQTIDPNKEDWELMKRFATLFDYTVNESSFSGACAEAFESALKACEDKEWKILAKENVQNDLAMLAVYFKNSLANYAISQNAPWTSELINRHIDIHSLDFQGNSALHTAAREGAAHLIPLLTSHLDMHGENNKNQTPLEIAIQFGQDRVVLELIKKRANINRLISVGEDQAISLTGIGFAVMKGKTRCIEKLIVEGKASLEDQCGEIGNLLHVAIYFHQFEALSYLLKQQKDKVSGLINQKNHSGLTPLILAVSLGQQDSVQLLHEAGAFLECEDNHQQRPMHYAADGLHFDIIQLLATLGCKLNPVDENDQRPIDLLNKVPGSLAASCKALLKSLKANKALRHRFPSPSFQPPKNLVFRGGGPKGLAFVGALTYLHEQGHLSSVKRVAGTSAGAITATLVAIGRPIDTLQKLLMTTDLMTFLDHSLPSKITQVKDQSTLQVIDTLQGVLHTCADIHKNPLRFIANQCKKLYRCTGICKGETFRLWMEEQIEFATGKKYLTFGELAELVESGSQFKHLHVYGTRLGSDPQIVHISSQDPECRNMIISDAIRISMSIPGVFKPHVMHILQKSGEQRDRIPYPQFGSFLDGGMLYNFPIETFDQKKYLTQEDLGPEGNCPKFNKETIGFSLFSSLTPQQTQRNVKNTGDLLKGICQVYLGAEEAIRSLNPYNQSRVIEIDVKDVGTLSFNMSDEKKKELVASGLQAMKTFIGKQTASPATVTDLEKAHPDHKEKKLKEAIESRKTILTKKRRSHPEKYPAYLENLLKEEYIHLYDHLLDMKALPTRIEREEKIRTLSFSEISHIILETQKSVIKQVTFTLPSDIQNVLFLLGNTGAGKSTTLCFLRGDEMVVDVNGKYSSTNKQDNLIGHGRESCTFLPTVKILSDLAIVDFPGFSDTNGSLISLGMECALKRLIEKYQPKILVLEAITNTEGRYAAAAQLGNQLKRLLGNTESCILGITKYSNDVNFVKVQSIEAEQRRELTRPSKEEQKLEAKIEALTELDDPSLKSKIEALTELDDPSLKSKIETYQKELSELKRTKLKQKLKDLPETEEKIEHRQEVQKKEKELREQIGLSYFIPLFDLENAENRKHCLNRLSSLDGGVSWSTQQLLHPNHKKLIEECFEKDLMPKIDGLQSFDIGNVDAFEQSVLKSSLIKVLLSSSHPEVGEFLHLPEIDPKIVDVFSKKIVKGCIKKIVDHVIKTIDVFLIKKALEEFGEKASPGKKEALEKKQKQLQEHIFGLKGIRADTPQQFDEKWKNLRKQKHARLEKIKEEVKDQYRLSPLQTIVYSIPLGIPLWIHNSAKQSEKKRAVTQECDDFFDLYCQSLDQVYSALIKLQGLKKIIKKKEKLNKVVESFSVPIESFECGGKSIDEGIDRVKEICGHED